MDTPTVSEPFCEYKYTIHWDGSVDVLFRNCMTGAEETRHYKNRATAKAQVTRFSRRMLRLYGADRSVSAVNRDGFRTSTAIY